MSGAFLPPVVTTLDGDIKPLLRELAKAEAAIKALANTSFDIKVGVNFDKASATKAKAQAKEAFSKPVTQVVESRWDMNSGIRAHAQAQAFAAANPIYQPVRYTADGQGNVGPYNRGFAIGSGRSFTPISGNSYAAIGRGWSDNPPGWGWNAPQGNSFPWWDRGISPAQQMAVGAGRQPLAIENGFPTRFNMTAGPNGVWRMPSFTNNYQRGPRGFFATAPWGIPMQAWHAIALGAMGLGAAAVGTGLTAGALGAVWYPGATSLHDQLQGRFQSMQAANASTYQILRAMGLNVNANGPLAQAQKIGNGQVLSTYGGLVTLINHMMGNGGGVFANQGVNAGSWISRTMAGLDLMGNKHPGMLNTFMQTASYDATNVGRSLFDIGSIASRALAHSPGEIEWLTGGLSHVLGAANWLLGPKDPIGGALLNTGMMYHTLAFGSEWLGKAMSAMGMGVGPMSFANLGGNLRGILGGGAMRLGLGQVGGLAVSDAGEVKGLKTLGMIAEDSKGKIVTAAEGIAGALGNMGGPEMFAVAAIATGLGLLVYHLVNTKDAVQIQIAAINAALGNLGVGTYNKSMGKYNNQALTAIGHLIATNTFTPQTGSVYGRFGPIGPGLGNNGADIQRWQQQFLLEGQNQLQINQFGAALNKTLHAGSAANAIGIANMAGITLNQLEKGGVKAAIQAVLNYLKGNAIGGSSALTGMTMRNALAGQTVTGPQWKQAAQINSYWDTYVGAMTSGGQGLNSLYTALMGTGTFSPASKIAASLNAKVGLIPTSAGIQSSGQPLMDFFRQAASVGAISGHSLQQSMLQVAGSMIPLAGNSKQAQDMLVALARESGVNVKNFAQLKSMTGGAAKSEKGLANSVGATMDAMAKLGPFASSVMQQVTKDIQQSFASVIAKSPAAQKAFLDLGTQISSTGHVSKQGLGDMQTLINYLRSQHMTVAQMAQVFQLLHINLDKIPANIRKQLHIETNAEKAAAQFHDAYEAWLKVPNGTTKSNSIDTFFNSYYSSHYTSAGPAPAYGGAGSGWNHPAAQIHKKHALGVRNAVMGHWSWVGERGPELQFIPAGSDIVPAHRVGQTMAAAMSATHGGGGDIHIYLDGKEVFGAVKSRTYGYNTVNGNRRPDGRPRGNMVPRG